MKKIDVDTTGASPDLVKLIEHIDKLLVDYEELLNKYRAQKEEYVRMWDVLRTYNPTDQELKYIGFENVRSDSTG